MFSGVALLAALALTPAALLIQGWFFQARAEALEAELVNQRRSILEHLRVRETFGGKTAEQLERESEIEALKLRIEEKRLDVEGRLLSEKAIRQAGIHSQSALKSVADLMGGA